MSKVSSAKKSLTVDIYTDGACSGNPGPGGWGVLFRYNDVEKTLCGGEKNTTNNRMELSAVIHALNGLTRRCTVTVHTDSQYVQRGVQEWLPNWKKRNWRTADNKPVKNKDLWEQLDQILSQHEINWKWVKGHSDHPENDRADALAREGMIPYL